MSSEEDLAALRAQYEAELASLTPEQLGLLQGMIQQGLDPEGLKEFVIPADAIMDLALFPQFLSYYVMDNAPTLWVWYDLRPLPEFIIVHFIVL
jgi:hypothetical protein